MKLILDISANTTNNDNAYAEKMINAIKAIDTGKHEIIFKTQLFEKAGNNIPMHFLHFIHIYNYCKKLRYKCTSSIFDLNSLNFLLTFDVPFVKIANRTDLYWLIGEVPRKVLVYVSVDNLESYETEHENCRRLFCISKYPADIKEYEDKFMNMLTQRVSDHTIGWELYHKYKPEILEKHYVLERSPDNPDSGLFAVTPTELIEIM